MGNPVRRSRRGGAPSPPAPKSPSTRRAPTGYGPQDFYHRLLVLVALLLLLVGSAGPLLAQDENPPAEPVEETPAEETRTEELTESEESPPGDESSTEEPGESAEQAAPPQEPQLTPEEQAKIEASRLKREARAAKSDAKKAKQTAKEAAKVSKEKGASERSLAKILDNGYAALAAEEYKNALQAFQNHVDEARAGSFLGHMGLARTRLAMGAAAEAVDQALQALKVAEEDGDKSEALVFAGEATLVARPRDETTGDYLPGTEMFVTNALRFYLRAIAADPEGAEEAREHLESVYPTPENEKSARLHQRYLETAPNAPAQHAGRLAAAYEALIFGSATQHVIVAGGITPPVKTFGPRPPYPQEGSEEGGGEIRRRLLAELFIDDDGNVSRARVLNGINRKLDLRAAETFGAWTFEPARLPNGKAVPVHWVVAANAVVEMPEVVVKQETLESEDPPNESDPEPDQ